MLETLVQGLLLGGLYTLFALGQSLTAIRSPSGADQVSAHTT